MSRKRITTEAPTVRAEQPPPPTAARLRAIQRLTSYAVPRESQFGREKLREQEPAHHPAKTPLDALTEARYQERFEALRLVHERNPGAVMKAVLIARHRDHDRFELPAVGAVGSGRIVHDASEDHWIEIPLWAYYALLDEFRDHLRKKHKGKGRTSRWEAQYREDLTHVVRWTTVKDMQEHPEQYEQAPIEGRRRGTKWERAARELEGSGWYGAPAMIRYSFREAEKRLEADPLSFIHCAFVGG